MKNLSVVNRSTSKGSIFKWSKDRALARCWSLVTITLFFCASAEAARPTPVGTLPVGTLKEAQKFHIFAESVELALLQAVKQSGHQLIMQGTGNSPNKAHDYIGTDTLPGLLSNLLFKSGLKYEILANNIVIINPEKPTNDDVVTLSKLEKLISNSSGFFENSSLEEPELSSQNWIPIRDAESFGAASQLISDFRVLHFTDLRSLNEWRSENGLTEDPTLLNESIQQVIFMGSKTDDKYSKASVGSDWNLGDVFEGSASFKLLRDSIATNDFSEEESLALARALLTDLITTVLCNIQGGNEPVDNIVSTYLSDENIDVFVFTANVNRTQEFENQPAFVSAMVSQNGLSASQPSVTFDAGLNDTLINDSLRTSFVAYEANIDDLQIGLPGLTPDSDVLGYVPEKWSGVAEVNYDDLFCMEGSATSYVGF